MTRTEDALLEHIFDLSERLDLAAQLLARVYLPSVMQAAGVRCPDCGGDRWLEERGTTQAEAQVAPQDD